LIKCIRTDSSSNDFVMLVAMLDAELAERDGSEHTFYAQYNKIDTIKNTVVAYIEDTPAGCGAFKHFENGVAEIKRMFTLPGMRKKGIAAAVLKELELWAAELGYEKCLLETGLKQPEAIALYERSGYNKIPNYGQYTGIENSVCFEKNLRLLPF